MKTPKTRKRKRYKDHERIKPKLMQRKISLQTLIKPKLPEAYLISKEVKTNPGRLRNKPKKNQSINKTNVSKTITTFITLIGKHCKLKTSHIQARHVCSF